MPASPTVGGHRPGARWAVSCLAAAVFACLAVVLSAPAVAGARGAGAASAAGASRAAVTEQTLSVPVGAEPDGTAVSLDAALYLPATTPAPAVLLAHGFGGSKADLADRARDLAGRGYVVLAYSARGMGNSGEDRRSMRGWATTAPETPTSRSTRSYQGSRSS